MVWLELAAVVEEAAVVAVVVGAETVASGTAVACVASWPFAVAAS